MENIFANQPLKIFGDGTQTRDFVSIEDVVTSIKLAMLKIEGRKGECYNIGSGKVISINELAKLMISISKKDLQVEYESPRKGDIPHSQSTILCAKRELGYSPKISLSEGLEKLLQDYFRYQN